MIKDMFVSQAKARETPLDAVITALVERYIDSYETNDIEARLLCFAPDGSFEDPVGTGAMVGHDALRAFFSQGSGMAIKAELESLAICGNEAAFTFRATLDAGEGGKVTIRPIETVQVNADGLIVRMRAYFDASRIS